MKFSRLRKKAGRSIVEDATPNGTYRVVYLYRDAGNYKFWGGSCIAGATSIDDLKPYLLHGEYFVPERIGIPSLVPDVRNDDDHSLHEFDSIVPAEPSVCVFTAKEFVGRVSAANEAGWFRCP